MLSPIPVLFLNQTLIPLGNLWWDYVAKWVNATTYNGSVLWIPRSILECILEFIQPLYEGCHLANLSDKSYTIQVKLFDWFYRKFCIPSSDPAWMHLFYSILIAYG